MAATVYAPTVELVLYEARGEQHVALTVYASDGKPTTIDSFISAFRDDALRRVKLMARRLGLTRVKSNPNIWRKLVPSEEF